MRTGVLSDQSILKHCAKYQPIPMHMTHSILNQSPILTTPYSSKKIKHVRQMSRPQTFDALATHLGKHSGSVELRELLHQALNNAISSAENDRDNNDNDNDNDNDNVTPATPATPAPVTPAPVTPAPVTPAVTVPNLANFPYLTRLQSLQQSNQATRTQFPQTPGVLPMGALTTPAALTPSPQGTNLIAGQTRGGTSYLLPDPPVQSA